MKKYILLFFVITVSFNLSAQLPLKMDSTEYFYGVINPKKAKELYFDVFGPQSPSTNFKDTIDNSFYVKFKQLLDLAPYVSYRFYNGELFQEQDYKTIVEAVDKDSIILIKYSVYQRLLDSNTDPAVKMVIVDDLLALGRNMVENLDSINVLRSNSVKEGTTSINDTISLPVAMVMYAHLYYKYAGNPKYYPSHLYDKELARDNFRKPFRMLLNSTIDPGDELQAYYVGEYYRACEDLYLSDKERYYEQFLQDYLEIIETCDNLLLPYIDGLKEKDLKYQTYNDETNLMRRTAVVDTINGLHVYSKTDSIIKPYGIKTLFPLTGADDSGYMSKYFLRKLPEHRNDYDYMEKALFVMNELGCNKTEAYYSFSKASYAIKPSYLNCLGCAFSSKELGMFDEMRNFYREAHELTQDSLEKGMVYYYISDDISPRERPRDEKGTLLKKETKEFSQWDDEMSEGLAYLNSILEYGSFFAKSKRLEDRKIPSNSAYKIHQIQYWLAHATKDRSFCDEAISNILLSEKLYPGLRADINGAINRVEALKKAIPIPEPSPRPGPRPIPGLISDELHAIIIKNLKFINGEIHMHGSNVSRDNINKFENFFKPYMNSPYLTDDEKKSYETYKNLKKKYNIR